MKISKWEELNGVKNEQYEIARVDIDYIIIAEPHKRAEYCILYPSRVSKEKTLAILKLFGFDIEFSEAPKLSKRAWHYVNYLPDDAWLAKDKDSTKIFVYLLKPTLKSLSGYWGGGCFLYVDDSLFPFITPDRAWSVKELRELEVQNDD